MQKKTEKPHSPMKVEALFNIIVQNEMLKETIKLYKKSHEVEQAHIIEAIVQYIALFEVDMKNI